MITLITGFAQSPDQKRSSEYDTCLRRNIENKHIGRIVLLNEESGSRSVKDWLSDPRVSVVNLNARACYSDFISAANELDGVVIVANSDVYFDWSVGKLGYIQKNVLFAITRTDSFDNLYSSDAWAFRPKLAVGGCDWSLGRSGCETAFCEQVVEQLGWRLWNPCYEVQVSHLHGSRVFTPERERCVGYKRAIEPELVFFNGSEFKTQSPSIQGRTVECVIPAAVPCQNEGSVRQ